MSGDLANCSFSNYTSKHAIKITSAGTYNWSNVSFDGSGTNDVETTHASGVVTINISGGGDIPTVTKTGAGTYVINNNQTVTVSGMTEGTAVKIIADETVGTVTAGDVLSTGFADSSGKYSYSQNYEAAFNPSGLDVIIRVRNQGIAVAAIAEDNGTGFTDETTEASSNSGSDMTLLPATPALNDAYYFGHNTEFARLKMVITQAVLFGTSNIVTRFGIDGGIAPQSIGGSGGTKPILTWEYYNGAWVSLSGVTDGTSSFANGGESIVSWTAPGDWSTTTVNSQGPLYYVRARLTTVGTITQAPAGAKVSLDVNRYLPFDAEQVISSTGLSTTASWVRDNISTF